MSAAVWSRATRSGLVIRTGALTDSAYADWATLCRDVCRNSRLRHRCSTRAHALRARTLGGAGVDVSMAASASP